MRIWDLPPQVLCKTHLVAEHRELHGLWNILTQGKVGYSHHPETKRWVGKQAALWLRHEALVEEFRRRRYPSGVNHKTLLEDRLAYGESVQTVFVDSPKQQIVILTNKGCQCNLELAKMWCAGLVEYSSPRHLISNYTDGT